MATNILMPALSPTMTEGKLAKWLKKEGDEVRSGDVLAEIETDKATMEVEAVDEGTLAKILIPDGTEGVAVNAIIGVITEDGEAAPDAAPAPDAGAGAAAKDAPSPVPQSTSFETPFTETRNDDAAAKPAAEPVTPDSATPQPQAAPPPSAPQPAAPSNGVSRIFVSPLARRLAKQAGVDLQGLQGSGPHGRIVKADVEKAGGQAKPGQQASATAAAPATPAVAAPGKTPAPPAINAPYKKLPNSSMRKVIAKRLLESKQTVPHFYIVGHFELDALLHLRADLNGRSPKDGDGAWKISVNDLLIKACAAALRRHPGVNASYTEEAILQYDDVDISVAVSIPDGLITPIVRHADQKGLAAISAEMKDLGARAKAGKLKIDEFQGGGFSISNLGMFGTPEFSAIINPPQAAILAIGAGEKRAVVKDGQLAVATMMTGTLSCDHRVIDGALGAQFMATLKSIVEDPLSLML